MIRLVWCCTSNPLGETRQQTFTNLKDCLTYIAAGHIPQDSAGYTAYNDAFQPPQAIIDYRRE